MDPRIGTELAGHRIEEVIGRGGASVVYLAEHLRLGRKVALKILAPHLAEDDAFRERFIRESRIAATLDHPNIVTIYDAGEVEDGLYISMRYVEGSDLGRRLRAEGPLDPSRVIMLLSQVASALDAAHLQGLVHRDVKPRNVLVEVAGSGLERAYLADFGISKRTTTSGGLTWTGQFVGTVDYVAPEQITGEPVDGRADVYSLGCMLFQCLTGRVPFRGDTEVATIYSQLHDPPPSITALVPAPEVLDDVLAKALAKSKEDRYGTCSSLIEAARGALVGERDRPTVVRSIDTAPERRRSTEVLTLPPRDGGPRRRRLAAWSAGGAGIALAVVGLLILVAPGDEPVTTPPEDPTGTPTTTTASPPPGSDPQIQWSVLRERVTPGDQSIYDVVATREVVVAVGRVEGASSSEHDAAVWYSENTDRWRLFSGPPLGSPGDQRLHAVAAFGELVVAGGWDGAAAGIWSSSDQGATWTASTSADLSVDTAQVRDFVTFGSTLVAVGGIGPRNLQDAAVWTSSDGLDWDLLDDADLSAVGDQQIWSVHAAGGVLIAVGYTNDEVGGASDGYDAAVWTSPDGRDWSRVDPAMLSQTGHQLMKAVEGGIDGLPLVVVGCEDDVDRCDLEGSDSDTAVWVSEDGALWTRFEPQGRSLVGEGIQTMFALTRQGSTFIAAGTATAQPGDLDAAIWTSSDGVTWSFRLHPRYLVKPLGGPGAQAIRALVPFHRRGLSLIAVGVTDSGTDLDAEIWGGR